MVADDHTLFVDGLCGLLALQPDFDIIGKASNGKEVLHFLNSRLPEVLIMDLNMPILDGQITAEKIAGSFPSIKILVLSMYNAPSLSTRLKSIGIKGYLPKDTDADLLFSVIREISSGNYYFREKEKYIPGLNRFAETDAFLKKYNLTHREIEILKLISENLSSKQIASKLFISLFTVDTHRKNMIQKLKLSGKTDLIKFAIQNNLWQKQF